MSFRSCLKFLAVLVLLLPGIAHAHAILEESKPAIGGSAPAGAVDLWFRYNSRIDKGRSRLTLIREDKSRDIVPIDDGGKPDIITAHVTLPPGNYVFRWQVLAVDGHITRGDVPVTVTAP